MAHAVQLFTAEHLHPKRLHTDHDPEITESYFQLNITKKCTHCTWSNLLGPLHIQDKMIIAKARYTGNCTSCIFPVVKIDECKTLNIEVTKTPNNHEIQSIYTVTSKMLTDTFVQCALLNTIQFVWNKTFTPIWKMGPVTHQHQLLYAAFRHNWQEDVQLRFACILIHTTYLWLASDLVLR